MRNRSEEQRTRKQKSPGELAFVHVFRGVPGHRPASGAALRGCRMTQREAAGAVTAGVVVTHPAKIQVVQI